MTLARIDGHYYGLSVLPVFLCLSACFTQPLRAITESGMSEVVEPRIESFLQGMVVDENFTGVALVVTNDQIIHAKGYGYSSPSVPNNVETIFHVASVTKQFTAAAIMQLVDARVLDLAESINAYLPEKYMTPLWNSVTVHHLLSHSSGITDYAVTRDYYDVVDGFCLGDTVDGMVQEAMSKDLEFAPGTKYAYSNIGFTLLGLIIERQTDTPYAQYMKENILQPLGMASSKVHTEGHVPARNEAHGHRWDDDKKLHVKDDFVSLPVTAPDGGLTTTLSDFLIWSQIFSGGGQRLLSEHSFERMTSQQIPIGRGGPLDAYGYGLYVGDRLIGHAGYIVGFRSQFIYDRETATLIAVFANNTTNDPQDIAFGLLTILFASDEQQPLQHRRVSTWIGRPLMAEPGSSGTRRPSDWLALESRSSRDTMLTCCR